MTEPVPAGRRIESPILELLASYDGVIRRVESLPLLVWLHSRPPGLSVTSRVKLPRPTWGASTLVRHHVLRSIDALLRDHAARAALGDLDAVGVSDRTALEEFRSSVRPVAWRRIIVTVLLAVLLVCRAMIALLGDSLRELAFGLLNSELNYQTKVQATADALLALSSSLSASSLSRTASQLAQAGPRPLAILAAVLLASSYVVLRPFSSAFRIKRMLFNLAPSAEPDLSDSCTTWHVTRSTGLYETERRLMRDADVPRERPFDLILSVIATTLVCSATASAALSNEGSTRSDLELYGGIVLVSGLLRLGWLTRAYRDRADGTTGRELPDYRRLRVTCTLVDRRPVSESMAWSVVPYLGALVWFRLARLTDRLLFEHFTRLHAKPRPQGLWLALASAALLFLFPPGALLGRVWHMRRLPTFRWGEPAVVVALGVAIWGSGSFVIFAAAPASQAATVVFVLYAFASTPLAVGVGQALANRHVDSLGDELPAGRSTSVVRMVDTRLVFNPPPGWPEPPKDWSPPPGWGPDTSWPLAPPGWQFWLAAPSPAQ